MANLLSLFEGLFDNMTVRHMDQLVSEMMATDVGDPKGLNHLLQKLCSTLQAMKGLCKEQIDRVMDSRRVIEFFYRTLKSAGDREIQYFVLSILLHIPMVLKYADWFAPAWFPNPNTCLIFKNLAILPPEKERYFKFLVKMNEDERDNRRVYSWRCSCTISKDDPPVNHSSGDMWLDLNLGTRTLSISLEEIDMRVPFNAITHCNINLKNVEGHKMLCIALKTKDGTSFSFLRFGANDVEYNLLTLHLQVKDRGNEEDCGNVDEAVDAKPIQELKSFQEVTRRLGNLENITPEEKHGIADSSSGLMFFCGSEPTLESVQPKARTMTRKRKKRRNSSYRKKPSKTNSRGLTTHSTSKPV